MGSRAPVLAKLIPAGAVPAPRPARLAPQLAVLGESPSDSAGWILKIMYDGYGLLTRVDRDVRFFTKNGHDWTAKLRLLRARVEAMRLLAGCYDGELGARGELGNPDFGRLQELLAKRDVLDCLAYYLFDLPYLLEHGLRQAPLVERRQALQAILAALRGKDGRYATPAALARPVGENAPIGARPGMIRSDHSAFAAEHLPVTDAGCSPSKLRKSAFRMDEGGGVAAFGAARSGSC
jgi:ATP-dependent DNA ligase